MKLKFKVLKTLVSVDFLIHRAVLHYNVSKRVCWKLLCVFAQLTTCALSGTEAFYNEDYAVLGIVPVYSRKL